MKIGDPVYISRQLGGNFRDLKKGVVLGITPKRVKVKIHGFVSYVMHQNVRLAHD
jgi:hypothetical protein